MVFTACGGAGNRIWDGEWSTINWSGYVLVGGHYTHVSASWVQPSVNCSATPTGRSAFWVGLDGSSGSKSIEQIGTEALCFHGRPFYRAWWLLYPEHPPVDYSNRVKPGDKVSASVTTDGNGHFTLILADPTEGWAKRTPATWKKARLATAEVIVEAPSLRNGARPFPLADFGTVSFTSATANGRPFSSLNGLRPVDMLPRSGKLKAVPSPIANGAFTVTWKHQ
ncbi:MAG TPA: G1 family glutamic endopeptidase [Gaiellaceae bacterium]|nr:G1 family glutamic endopeptidase [Gaiellaceae bacterium]